MNKKYFAALSATALIGVVPNALAASSTDLTVTGIITPSACTPTLSGGGIVDHGKLSAKDLHQDKPTSLPTATLQLSVNCDSATTLRLKPIDNRPESTALDPYDYFGLGFINGNQKLGGVEVRMINPQADGVGVRHLVSQNNGDTWSSYSYMQPDTLSAFGAVAGPAIPIAIKDLVSEFWVHTVIARADSLDLSNEVALDGSVTLEILY